MQNRIYRILLLIVGVSCGVNQANGVNIPDEAHQWSMSVRCSRGSAIEGYKFSREFRINSFGSLWLNRISSGVTHKKHDETTPEKAKELYDKTRRALLSADLVYHEVTLWEMERLISITISLEIGLETISITKYYKEVASATDDLKALLAEVNDLLPKEYWIEDEAPTTGLSVP